MQLSGLAPTETSVLFRTIAGVASTAFQRARAEAIGLTWYVWQTSQDGRVRPSHKGMQGVLVQWQDPPSPELLVGEPELGRYHAGEGLGCRCLPSPVVSIGRVTWPSGVYFDGKILRMSLPDFTRRFPNA